MPYKFGAVLVCLLLVAAFSLAQSTDATVSGTISDPSGAHVVGVTVIALNNSTGVASSTTTNDAGVFIFAALPPSQYRISAEHTGFRKAVMSDVTLEVGAKLTLNLSLELGATTESVEVQSGGAADIAYSTSSVGNVVTGRKILELPLAGRSTYDLIATQAGVVGANFSGNRTGSLNVTTDGINTQDNLLNNLFNIGVANQIRVDRVEEFRIITSPTDVELGRGSGQIQVITRSGGNVFHGSLFAEHRNTVFNANNFFNNARGTDPITGKADFSARHAASQSIRRPAVRSRQEEPDILFRQLRRRETPRPLRHDCYGLYAHGAQQPVPLLPRRAECQRRCPHSDGGLTGNPIRPSTATADLQTVSIFGRDPNRLVPDASGVMSEKSSP